MPRGKWEGKNDKARKGWWIMIFSLFFLKVDSLCLSQLENHAMNQTMNVKTNPRPEKDGPTLL